MVITPPYKREWWRKHRGARQVVVNRPPRNLFKRTYKKHGSN